MYIPVTIMTTIPELTTKLKIISLVMLLILLMTQNLQPWPVFLLLCVFNAIVSLLLCLVASFQLFSMMNTTKKLHFNLIFMETLFVIFMHLAIVAGTVYILLKHKQSNDKLKQLQYIIKTKTKFISVYSTFFMLHTIVVLAKLLSTLDTTQPFEF